MPSRTRSTPRKRQNNEVLEHGSYSADTTPQKTQFDTMNQDFNVALNYYFSPKKKSPKSGLSPKRGASKSPKRIQRKIDFTEDSDGSEDLNKENLPAQPDLICDLESLKNCFDVIDKNLPEQDWTEDFENWMTFSHEFNLLLYGIGSKKELLQEFAKSELSNFDYVICNGFQWRVSARTIFEHIVEEFGLKVKREENLTAWATKICEAMDHIKLRLYLLINNIDGHSLRDPAQQEALSVMARQKFIRIIATVDHVNATLLWNQKTRDAFNWLFVPVSTMKACGDELLAGESKILGLNIKRSGYSHSIDSLEVFWQASTDNNRKILQQLAIHAGHFKDKNIVEPLMLTNFCKILKREFATTSESVLRQQLTEFIDHHVIQMSKEGSIQLSVDRNLLVSFLDTKSV